MTLLLFVLYLWTCGILYLNRGEGYSPGFFLGGLFTPHGAIAARSPQSPFIGLTYGILLLTFPVSLQWIDSSEVTVVVNAVLLTVLLLLELSAICLLPLLLRKEIERHHANFEPTPNPFPVEEYPILWIFLSDQGQWQEFEESPEVSSLVHPIDLNTNGRLRRGAAMNLPTIKRILPTVQFLLMSDEGERYLVNTWSELIETTQRQAEKALQAEESERAASSRLVQLGLEVDKLKEANQVIHQQLISLRSRQRGYP